MKNLEGNQENRKEILGENGEREKMIMHRKYWYLKKQYIQLRVFNILFS